ncbi:trimeric autotransporter adhesin [Hydromonas duriensis]|uniref:Trimeric autotransporter adhesin n=2 Tax=Hydromonas duriensis TaxID=1527608 RepID=A0A4V3DJJ4_9BURK|nr:trimeric autotransporter adhesin [Hydromonas duriensis]
MAFGTKAVSSGSGSIAIGANSSSSGSNSVALGANSVADGSTLSNAAYNPGSGSIAGVTPVGEVSVGSSGAERRITNVAAGSADTDAVNVSQLKAVRDGFNSDIKDLKGGIAAALALESAPSVAGKFTTYMGVGYYDGQSAIGISGRKTADNGRWSISGGVTASQQGKVGARLGFAKVWDDNHD